MNRVTEIQIEGVGTVRHLTSEDARRVRTCHGPNKFILPYALACGLTLKKFKSLSIDKQREVAQAYNALTSPANIEPVRKPKADDRLFQPRIHRSDAEKIEMGKFFIQQKNALPHGYFGLWLRDKAGVSEGMAQECMRWARTV